MEKNNKITKKEIFQIMESHFQDQKTGKDRRKESNSTKD